MTKKTKVRIQIIEIYDIWIEHEESEDPIDLAYQMQSTDIAQEGYLIDVETDNAEIWESDELNGGTIAPLV